MYAKAKIGGFLHLCIGEEATIVGATQALRDTDYLMSTYREHGQALARGTPADEVMAELFGKAGGCSGGRGGSMHLFDFERRFLGGYGIVGGNLPLAAGVALASDYTGTDDATLCMFGDGATNQGTFGETMNLAALWKLPVVFMVINNQFGMGTALERHSAVTDLSRKSEGFGVPGERCDGMDVLDVHATVVARRWRRRAPTARRSWWRPPPTATAATRWPTPRSTAPRTRWRSGARATRSRPSRAAGRGGRAERGRREAHGRRGDEGRGRGGGVRRRVAVPRPGLALRRRVRDRRAGAPALLVLDRRALARHPPRRGGARRRRGGARAGRGRRRLRGATRTDDQREARARGEGG